MNAGVDTSVLLRRTSGGQATALATRTSKSIARAGIGQVDARVPSMKADLAQIAFNLNILDT
jgi:hypothetical protein